MKLADLFEALDKVADWEEDETSAEFKSWVFTSNQRVIRVTAFDRNESVWEVAFAELNSKEDGETWELSGSGGELEVFSTVIDILRHFVKKQKPNEVIFSASKSENRVKLYRKLVRRADIPGYTMVEKELVHDVEFMFKKD